VRKDEDLRKKVHGLFSDVSDERSDKRDGEESCPEAATRFAVLVSLDPRASRSRMYNSQKPK